MQSFTEWLKSLKPSLEQSILDPGRFGPSSVEDGGLGGRWGGAGPSAPGPLHPTGFSRMPLPGEGHLGGSHTPWGPAGAWEGCC